MWMNGAGKVNVEQSRTGNGNMGQRRLGVGEGEVFAWGFLFQAGICEGVLSIDSGKVINA